MADIPTIINVAIQLGAGGILLGLGRWFGKRLDQPVTVLQVENERLRGDLKKLGEKYDNLESRTLATAVRAIQDSSVDDALVEDLPTGIRDSAKLIAKKSDPPKVTPPNPPPRRIIEVDARKPGAMPTDPAPPGYPRRGRP